MVKKRYGDKDEYLGPGTNGVDITPSATELPEFTRFIMVSADDTIVTGTMAGDTVEHTTFGLKAGLIYPLSFKTITVVTGGTVKGYF